MCGCYSVCAFTLNGRINVNTFIFLKFFLGAIFVSVGFFSSGLAYENQSGSASQDRPTELASLVGEWNEVATSETLPFCWCNSYEFSETEVPNSLAATRWCESPDGAVTQIGTLKSKRPRAPWKLTLKMGPLPVVYPNFWILHQTEEIVVASTRLRRPIWVWSREKEISPQELRQIQELLYEKNHNGSLLQAVHQCFAEEELP